MLSVSYKRFFGGLGKKPGEKASAAQESRRELPTAYPSF
jgi:hypothetical protein